MTANNKTEFGQILELLNKLDSDVRETNKRVDKANERIEKWDERYFQLVKEQGNTARTIIIGAASVVIFSPVLGAAADLIRNHFIK